MMLAPFAALKIKFTEILRPAKMQNDLFVIKLLFSINNFNKYVRAVVV